MIGGCRAAGQGIAAIAGGSGVPAGQRLSARPLKVSEQKKDSDQPLTGDEITEFVSDLADHLGDNQRVIDPVIFGDAGLGTVEIVFGMPRSASERDTHVAVFDIIHGAGKSLGCEWRNDLESSDSFGRSSTTRTLERQSQLLQATGDFVDA